VAKPAASTRPSYFLATRGGGSTRPRKHGHSANSGSGHDRILLLIAIERTIRAIVLVAIGIVLVTHPHTNWANTISNLAHDLGFDPRRNGIEKIIAKASLISSHRYAVYGVIALAYGALEGAEAYGLWRRRRWGEYLTVLATALFFIPEIWELAKSATPLKLAALVLNVVVVIYLVVRLRRR